VFFSSALWEFKIAKKNRWGRALLSVICAKIAIVELARLKKKEKQYWNLYYYTVCPDYPYIKYRVYQLCDTSNRVHTTLHGNKHQPQKVLWVVFVLPSWECNTVVLILLVLLCPASNQWRLHSHPKQQYWHWVSSSLIHLPHHYLWFRHQLHDPLGISVFPFGGSQWQCAAESSDGEKEKI